MKKFVILLSVLAGILLGASLCSGPDPVATSAIAADDVVEVEPDEVEDLCIRSVFEKIEAFQKVIQREMGVVSSHALTRVGQDRVRRGLPPLPAGTQITLNQRHKWELVPVAQVSTSSK